MTSISRKKIETRGETVSAAAGSAALPSGAPLAEPASVADGQPVPPATHPAKMDPDALVMELEREFVLLSRLLVAIRSKYRYQLERAHYVILILLEDKGPLPIGAIAQNLLLDNSTASRQIAAMERMGLAERADDPQDQRRAIVRSTDKGRELMADMRVRRIGDTEFIISDWAEEDRECFTRLLKTFNRTLIRKLSGKEPQWTPEEREAP